MKKYISIFALLLAGYSASAGTTVRDSVPALYGFWNYTVKTGAYTMTADDGTINCTSGTFTIDLPTALGIVNRVYIFKNSGAGTITIDGASTQTIDGNLTVNIAAGGFLWIQSTGTNWIIINQ